jgi:hypothetical protein
MSENKTSIPSALDTADSAPGRSDGRRMSRRALFTGAAALATFWGDEKRRAFARPDPPEVSADVDPGALLVKLVRRVTFGFSEAELAIAASLGYQGYLEYHLNHTAIDDSAVNLRLALLSTLTMSFNQLVALQNQGQVINEITEATILRAFQSRRQLFERVVEFWTDHFNIDITNEIDGILKPLDDREVIRPNALGTFPALLSASAHSPAMLFYLNNDVSTAESPNENYPRELMELHTMGTDGGYTQQDVVEVARCFTGWTWWSRNGGILNGSFRYNATTHDNNQKIVLGNIIPAGGGMQDGVTVLNILSEHPSTARFIARKLCNKFVSEDCPQSIVDHVTNVYTQTGGDIKAMLRAAFQPNIQADATPKYKRPFHHFISAMRALPTTVNATSSLRNQLTAAGHRPFYWGPPDGYPDDLAYWSGLIIPRWNFGASLMANQLSGLSVDYAAFFAGLNTADLMVDRISQALFGGEMPSTDRDRIREYLLPNIFSTTRQREAIGLAIGSPGFQWH